MESEDNLARLEPTTRHLVIVLIEAGLRAGDACTLAFDPLVPDSVGWPCLRFDNSKVGIEQLLPLSAKGVDAVRAQQEGVGKQWPAGSPWLFPDPHANPDGSQPYPYRALQRRLASWQARIGAHDEAGRPVRVTAHQLRHTLGSRLINAGVPTHVVQRVLGHATPTMTAVYAHLHDSTVREAFERYHQTRVDIAGRLLDYDPEAPTADAEWGKHNLARIQASLPNGYCGRPPQQDCPHPNACLTCPDFQTTIEFLDGHRTHAERNRVLIARAEADGRLRLVANHRRSRKTLSASSGRWRASGRATMPGPGNSHYLVSAARQRHDQALSRAREVLRRLEHAGEPVTFASVADAASVPRGWLYRVPELRAAIVALRSARPSLRTRSVPAAQRASTESLRRRLEALREEITRLRDENAQLRDRVARLYGERRVNQLLGKEPEPDQVRR